MYLTWLDSNSWLIELSNKRILLDPWLVGPLTFGNLPWLFKGERRQACEIPANIDLILLSQGLEDHTHPPTLQQLDRAIPVIGSPAAAKVAKSLGFAEVTPLTHGEQLSWQDQIQIQATVGSPVGPGVNENGYILRDLAGTASLYYEPHGYHSPELENTAPVDVVITPLVSLDLLIAPFIRGGESALKAVQWLHPQAIISTAAGGDIEFQGLLMSIIRLREGIPEFRQRLLANNLTSTQVLEPEPWQRFEVPLSSSRPIAA
jgi:L-ascorbate metabolism protein UlaG (beta-lactamase superfamily)